MNQEQHSLAHPCPELCRRDKLKRKRGGPKGNQNARKHGFYSRALSPSQIGEFWNLIALEGLDPEIALIRIKLRSSLQHAPANPRVLRKASRLLANWYSAKLQLDKTESSHLKEAIVRILESSQPRSGC